MEVSKPYPRGDISPQGTPRFGALRAWSIYLHTQLVFKRDRKPMKGAHGLLVFLVVCIKLGCLCNCDFGEEFETAV